MAKISAKHNLPKVVPLAGTWVEISSAKKNLASNSVVPLAGTWVEIAVCAGVCLSGGVVPLAGTWVEIL